MLAEVTTDFRNGHGKLLKMRICRKSAPDFYVISAGRYYGYNHFFILFILIRMRLLLTKKQEVN